MGGLAFSGASTGTPGGEAADPAGLPLQRAAGAGRRSGLVPVPPEHVRGAARGRPLGEYGEIILGKMRDGQRGLIVPYRFLEPYALIEDWPGDWERPVVA